MSAPLSDRRIAWIRAAMNDITTTEAEFREYALELLAEVDRLKASLADVIPGGDR